MRDGPRWVPGPTFLAGLTTAISLAGLAVLTRRPDLLVLALPLIGVATWSLTSRPTGRPQLAVAPAGRTPTEGMSTRWSAHLTGGEGAEQWHVVIDESPTIVWDDNLRVAARALDSPTDRCDLTFATRRWGPAQTGAAEIVISGPWAAFLWGPVHVPGHDLRATPRTESFNGRAPLPHPDGLVGPNRSRRFGDGLEFADIRPFRPGDKLRAIHWPVTQRTGVLQVRTSHAEQDAQVHLVLDASCEIGAAGADTSLDLGLRACAALSNYFLGRGERVGFDAIGAAGETHVPVSLGQRQHRRIVSTLSSITVGRICDRRPEQARMRIGSGALVFVVSPLMGDLARTVTARLAARGLAVVLIDCLPSDLGCTEDDAWDVLSQRIRMLERAADIDDLDSSGVPVVPWRGPGSLDVVLQGLARRPHPKVRAL